MFDIDMLRTYSLMHDWDEVCDYAEKNIKPLKNHLETWGKHCGAPYDVYRGHLVKMILEINDTK